WSVDFSHSQLGEDEFSYGFDGRGLKVENGKFEEFGESFGENDVIGCFADFEGEELVELSFSKNGQELGTAFQVPKGALGERALLPHVLCKGCAVELNFGQRPEPLSRIPSGIPCPIPLPSPVSHREFPPQVLLMVGLPGSGKTQWAQKHSQENRDKRYNILGTERVLHQLRVSGGKQEFRSRELLTQQAAQCLSKLVQIAPRARRNFILDQRRKLSAFKGFCRKVVVIVPPEPEWEQRLQQRRQSEGDDVPESVMLEMKANYSIPEKNEYVDEVLFGELGRDEAAPLVLRWKEEARKQLPPSEKRGNRRNNRNKRNRQNRNRGQGYGQGWGQRRGYDSRVYGGQQQPQYWGQPGNRGVSAATFRNLPGPSGTFRDLPATPGAFPAQPGALWGHFWGISHSLPISCLVPVASCSFQAVLGRELIQSGLNWVFFWFGLV
uniref:Heteroous nuclear ribonucleoprotein U like 2 n=1 Tax=Serinus canaria TaxID=9135 RepID=A0A8C9N0G4_SERCA